MTQPFARHSDASQSASVLTPENEAHWASGIRDGNVAVFDAVFDACYEPLCYLAMSFVHSREVAEELVQDVFLGLWHRRAVLDPMLSVRGYLVHGVRRRAWNHLRHERVVEQWEAVSKNAEIGQGAEPTDTGFDRAQLVEATARAVSQLPPRCRQMFVLSRAEGLSYAEIARRCNVSIKTVETQLARAIKALRGQLAAYL